MNLPENEVHVWRRRLDVPSEQLKQLQGLLSEDEQSKAARFRFDRDRQHYTVARATLRILLGGYLSLEPRELRFCYNAFGKPELVSDLPENDLRFNLAHSHGLALMAFNRRRQIGIDVEWIRPDFATEEIARRFFAPAEVKALCALPKEARSRAFFNCWTRKEAFIKARGLGLSLQLSQFAVTLSPGENAALISAQDDAEAQNRWVLRELIAGEGYVAALAVEGHGWELKFFD